MPYDSNINVRLSQIASIPEQFSALQPNLQMIHNAIHILNSSLTPITDFISVPKETDSIPDTLTFAGKMFWGRCANDVVAGRIVRPADDKWRLGPTYRAIESSGNNVKFTTPFGFTLGDPEDGKILIGIPPGAVPADGLSGDEIGKRIYSDNSGELSLPAEVKNEDVPVGIVIETNTILLTYGAMI